MELLRICGNAPRAQAGASAGTHPERLQSMDRPGERRRLWPWRLGADCAAVGGGASALSGLVEIAGAIAAIAALVIAAFIAGRASRDPRQTPMAGLSQQARERILAISLADHLDRAEVLLTEFSNTSDADAGDLSGEVASAQDLVEEGRLLRQSVARDGASATLALLDEVERFMLEVANSTGRLNPADLSALRERIGSGSLLFKVRIIESNLRTEGQKS